MVGTGRNVVVKDGKGSCVDVGNGLLNNNNVLLIVIAIVILSCFCGGNNAFMDSCGCGGRRRRRGRDRGLNNLFFLLIPLLFLRGGSSGPNTNTNIINVDSLLDGDDGGGGFLDL